MGKAKYEELERAVLTSLCMVLFAGSTAAYAAPTPATYSEVTGDGWYVYTENPHSPIKGAAEGGDHIQLGMETSPISVTGSVYGGCSENGQDTSGSAVKLSTGSSFGSDYIYGGYSRSNNSTVAGGNVTNNTVIIQGKITTYSYFTGIYGGYSSGASGYREFLTNGGTVSGNTVEITGTTDASSLISSPIYGGYSIGYYAGNVKDNTVTVQNRGVNDVYGGMAQEGYPGDNTANQDHLVSGNSVSLENSEAENVYGGRSQGARRRDQYEGGTAGSVINNSVTITNSHITNDVVGGNSVGGNAFYHFKEGDGGKVSGNRVTVNGMKSGYSYSVEGNVYGGLSTGGKNGTDPEDPAGISGGNGGIASGNNVLIGNPDGTDTRIKGNVYGGASVGSGAQSSWSGGGGGDASAAEENVVTIYGTVGKNVYGGYSAGNAGETGSYVGGPGGNSGDARNNQVNIYGHVQADVYGGYSSGGKGAHDTPGSFGGEDGTCGSATGNEVLFRNGTADGSVYGAYTKGLSVYEKIDDISGNSVSLQDSTVRGDVFGAFANNKSNVKENSVSLKNSTVGNADNLRTVAGGYRLSHGDSLTGNSVEMINSKVFLNNVYGGFSEKNGDVYENKVTIDNGALEGSIVNLYGAYGNGNVYHNTLELKSGAAVNIYGGSSVSGSVYNSEVNLDSADFKATGKIYGGHSNESAKVYNNTVRVANGNEAEAVYAGYSYSGTVHDNTLTLTKGKAANVYGGATDYGTVQDTNVTVDSPDFTVTDGIYGGYSKYASGKIKDVTVTVSNGKESQAIYGGYGGSSIDHAIVNLISGEATNVYGGAALKGSVQNSAVNMSGGTAGNVYGGHNEAGAASVNTVNMTGGTVQKLYGGYSQNGTADTNTVTLSNGTVTNSLYGAYAEGGAAENNTVHLQGGQIQGPVYGGDGTDAKSNTVNVEIPVQASVYGGLATNGAARGNTVNVRAFVTNDVYGGNSKAGEAIDNVINLYTDVGGMIHGGHAAARSEGNTLNIHQKELTAGGVEDVQTMNFYLPAGTVANDTMLHAKVVVPDGGLTVNAYANGKLNLRKGDSVYLTRGAIDASRGTIQSGVIAVGVTKDYTLELHQQTQNIDSDYVRLTIPGKEDDTDGLYTNDDGLKPQTGSLTETPLLSSTLVASGAELLLSADRDYLLPAKGKTEYIPYFLMSRDHMRYNTGSHIDANGYGVNAGVVRRLINHQGELLVAPFFEYGHAAYDSYLDSGEHADGKVHFAGGGLFARQRNNDGFYYEGSVRAGRVSGDYDSNDLTITGFGKTHEDYDYDTPYYAFHLGLGKVRPVGTKGSLDTYLRYFYSHQGSFDAQITTGERYDFDSVTSSRVRLGTKYTCEVNPVSTYYAGIAYQYEFDNEANASYHGDATPSPSLQGSSGMLELGYQAKPDADSNMTMDFRVTGWCGKQEGLSFRLGAKWEL